MINLIQHIKLYKQIKKELKLKHLRFLFTRLRPLSFTFKSEDKIIKGYFSRKNVKQIIKYSTLFSKITKTPKIFSVKKINFENKQLYLLIFEYIHEPFSYKIKKIFKTDEIIKRSAFLLVGVHQKRQKKDLMTFMYNILISEHHNFEAEILLKNKKLFQKEGIYLVHGDFHTQNLLFNNETYLIDFDSVGYFDYYIDFVNISHYLTKKKFKQFIKYYEEKSGKKFNEKRFMINLLIYYSKLKFYKKKYLKLRTKFEKGVYD